MGEHYTAISRPTKPHLQFQIYANSEEADSLVAAKQNYTQTLKFLKNRFVNYHKREQVMVKRRMEMLPHMAEVAGDEPITQNPFTSFYGISERLQEDVTFQQNTWTP